MPRGSFSKDLLTMASGSAIAQAIPLAVSPILSRLYTPESFGVFSTTVAVASILGIASTGRFELAVVLPSERRDALAIARGVIFLSASVCGLAWALLALASSTLPQLGALSKIGAWQHLIPIFAFGIGLASLGSFLANRDRSYLRMATAVTTQQAVAAGVAISIGAAHLPVNGLLAGRLAGVFANAAILFREIHSALSSYRTDRRLVDSFRTLVRYRQFAFFNLPYSVIGTFSREFVVFSLMFAGAVEAAGSYGLVRSALAAPISFLSASLSQVYYREAAERSATAEFAQLTFRLLLSTSLVMAPALALVFIWGPDIFAVVFGEQWREAGTFAKFLALPTLLSVMTSWPERIFEVRAKQSWSLAIQVGFDILSIGCLVLALKFGATPVVAIGVYAIVQAAYHLTYLSAVFVLVPLPPSKFCILIGSVFAACATMWGVNELLSHATTHAWVQFLLGVIAATLLSTCGLVAVRSRNWQR